MQAGQLCDPHTASNVQQSLIWKVCSVSEQTSPWNLPYCSWPQMLKLYYNHRWSPPNICQFSSVNLSSNSIRLIPMQKVKHFIVSIYEPVTPTCRDWTVLKKSFPTVSMNLYWTETSQSQIKPQAVSLPTFSIYMLYLLYTCSAPWDLSLSPSGWTGVTLNAAEALWKCISINQFRYN